MHGLVIDNFAGGGGASTGIEAALGRPVDAAINHDREAVAMHTANHPATRHYAQNIWQVDPRDVVRDCGGGRIRLAWFSPDCKHFSKAKGSKPVEKRIRDLAWTVVHWGKLVRPDVIALENVEEFQTWGPLIATDDGKMVPCPDRRGDTFKRWVRALRSLGYRVEWRELRACDYGAPTIRKRLFLVARCDGAPIVWPQATHGPGLLPYRTAADCIDWSIPVRSIFNRERPLAEATMRRIARGVKRYVLDAERPFIVPMTHGGDDRVHSIDEPMRTITAAHRGELSLAVPFFAPRYGERDGQEPRCQPADVPIATIVPTANGAQLVAAFMAQHNTGMVGHAMSEPVSTIVQKGCTQALCAAFMTKFRGTSTGSGCDEPLHTITANSFIKRPGGGSTHGLVAAFLTKYYGQGEGCEAGAPLHTVTTKDRFGLVTVTIDGQEWVIVDIGMRMLTPRELFNAQGFPGSYILDAPFDGKPLTKTAQIRMCGNSVSPPVAEALIRANLGDHAAARMAA